MNRGFTLLECMIALLLVSTALVIVVEAQWWGIEVEDRSNRINAATMLARDLMTDLELRMEVEGFGTLEVKERGDFADDRFGGQFDSYRWEWEVEQVDLDKMPNLSGLMGFAGEGADAMAESAGGSTGGAEPVNELEMLSALGVDMSFFGEMMGSYLREARVRVCFPDGFVDGKVTENCIELTSHLVNPTGQVTDNEEEEEEDGEVPGERP